LFTVDKGIEAFAVEQLRQSVDSLSIGAIGAAFLRLILWDRTPVAQVGYRGMSATETFFSQQGLPVWPAWLRYPF
jgi:hypothetical protein